MGRKLELEFVAKSEDERKSLEERMDLFLKSYSYTDGPCKVPNKLKVQWDSRFEENTIHIAPTGISNSTDRISLKEGSYPGLVKEMTPEYVIISLLGTDYLCVYKGPQ